MEFAGLIIELLIIFGIPLLIPIFIILFAGNLSYNEKIKKIILSILSIIYNGVAGFISPLLFFCLLALLMDISSQKIVYLIILFLFAIILILINIFMIKKSKINAILYIILNFIIFALSFMVYVILMRGSIDL